MLRKARSVGLAVATLTPLAALAVGEAAQQYDDSNKVVYAKQQLLKWRSASETQANSDESKVTMPGASAWLGSAPPKFPYLLSISAGDNPAVVTNTLLDGVKVLGSYDESTRDTLKRLTTPTSSLEVALRSIAARYSELKSTLHGRLPEDFDPRVGLKASAEDMMMDALLDALRDLQYAELEYGAADEEREGGLSPISQNGRVTALPVFLLRDFDGFSDQDAEKWLRWTHQISSEGLAHVVLLTTSTVTPSKMEWIQARHQSGQNADSGGSQDFVAILLRPANGLVDQTSAEEKLREILKSYELDLVSDGSEATDAGDQSSFDQPTIMSASQSDQRTAEMEIILKVAGNWWSDIDAICQRLMDSNLNDVTLHEERVGVIQEVCHNFLQDTETRLLKELHLDGSLQLPRNYSAGYHFESTSASASIDPIETSKAFSALETWKCLETLVDVTPVTGGNALIGSPQQLLKQKNKTPLNCVSPVEALLPFNYRDEGEQKFLDLIDQQVLFLRPKDVVEIGVIPCKKSALVSPCWVQTRPVIKKAFEKIHRSDAYFRVILDLDRFAANIEMRKEIEQYEQEIAERRQALSDMKRDFAILQFSMTPAEKAQRKAELALIDVELQAKDVYLEKLRSLLTP